MEKTEVKGFYKKSEGVIINKDNESLKAYKRKKEQAKKMIELENDVSSMKDDIKEIKDLLRSLVK
jgi:BioD-like phosphotransacetylase family protein